MSEIKSVISLLCRHIEQCTGLKIESEHFRIAKFNEESIEAAQCFWAVLHSLSCTVVQNLQPELNFESYSKSTKLNFAYLQYPSIEFYGLIEESNENSRALLLALAWLIARHNALEVSMKLKLAESVLGHECVQIDESHEYSPITSMKDEDFKDQALQIVHKCSRISNNLKEINELTAEKIKTTTKIHTASLSSCGLLHIHLPEMSIVKQFVTHDNSYSDDNEKNLEDLQWKGLIIDTQFKWRKNEHVFFNWMETVLDEHKSTNLNEPMSEKTLDEISTIICILRHLSKKKNHSLKNGCDIINEVLPSNPIVSRLSRVKEKSNETNKWQSQINHHLDAERDSIKEKMSRFTLELRMILQSISNSLQI